jgi:hypothetical protein
MDDAIHLLQPDGSLREVRMAPYDFERDLQRLLADHPSLLPGAQIDSASPLRWLLVKREVGVPKEQGGGTWWSLDHLFVDQNAMPTFVEVKRSTDTRARREVVAQMLEYAANGTEYWSAAETRAQFEARLRVEGKDANEELVSFLHREGEDAETVADEFWAQFGSNLAESRVRLLFVADEIPASLRRLVEFLNAQMDRLEILAVEIRQYKDDAGLAALVPRVIGATAQIADKKRKAGGLGPRVRSTPWTEEQVVEAIRTLTPAAAPHVDHILSWAHASEALVIRGGTGVVHPSLTIQADTLHPRARFRSILSVYPDDKAFLEVNVKRMGRSISVAEQQQLLAGLAQVGLDHPLLRESPFDHRPNFDLSLLSVDQIDQLLSVIDVWLNAIRKHHPSNSEPAE